MLAQRTATRGIATRAWWLPAAALCAALVLVAQDGSVRAWHAAVRLQLQQLGVWNSGALGGTANLVKRCAHGNDKACDALAGDPGAVAALERIDAKNPNGFTAKHPHKAAKLQSKYEVDQPSHLYRTPPRGAASGPAARKDAQARTAMLANGRFRVADNGFGAAAPGARQAQLPAAAGTATSLASAGKAVGRTNLASTSSSFGEIVHPDAREEYDSAKAAEYAATNPDEEVLKKNDELAAEAQNEYAIEEGVRSAAGVGVPKPGGKWGGGLEEFGVDLKGNPIKTSGYAFMP